MRNADENLNTRVLLLLLLGLLALATAIAVLLPAEQRAVLLREHGPVESASVLLYLAGAVLLVTSRRIERTFGYWTASILIVCAARELDFHKAFTSDGITKTRYYLDGSIPAAERIVAGVVMVALALWMVRYAARYWSPFVASLRSGETFAWAALVALVLAPVSKLLDGAHRHIRGITGDPVPRDVRSHIGAFEEVLEVGIPIFVLCAIAAFVRAARRGAVPDFTPGDARRSRPAPRPGR